MTVPDPPPGQCAVPGTRYRTAPQPDKPVFATSAGIPRAESELLDCDGAVLWQVDGHVVVLGMSTPPVKLTARHREVRDG